VSKSYGAAHLRKEVVSECSFTIERGKLTVMIGPSGCGKSTLIRLLAGFEKPTSGTITLNGEPVTGPARDRLVLFQETALFPWMTTYDNILYGPRARGEVTPETLELAEFLLNKVGLQDFRNKYPTQLSGGMQRRAELARAMINNPAIMILDEPFRGLDAMTKELMWEYYSALYERTGARTSSSRPTSTKPFFSRTGCSSCRISPRRCVRSSRSMCLVRGGSPTLSRTIAPIRSRWKPFRCCTKKR
jgi:NitT/TauT family transport system ATP-binding protein